MNNITAANYSNSNLFKTLDEWNTKTTNALNHFHIKVNSTLNSWIDLPLELQSKNNFNTTNGLLAVGIGILAATPIALANRLKYLPETFKYLPEALSIYVLASSLAAIANATLIAPAENNDDHVSRKEILKEARKSWIIGNTLVLGCVLSAVTTGVAFSILDSLTNQTLSMSLELSNRRFLMLTSAIALIIPATRILLKLSWIKNFDEYINSPDKSPFEPLIHTNAQEIKNED